MFCIFTSCLCILYKYSNITSLVKKDAIVYGFICQIIGYMILDTMVRAELIETSYLSIPIMLMAIGFSMGIGSNIFPYMAMSCTVFSLGFCYAFNWLFLIGYNLTFNVFIYHNFQETTIIEFLAVVCGIYT